MFFSRSVCDELANRDLSARVSSSGWQHFLYFSPEPQSQGSFRPSRDIV